MFKRFFASIRLAFALVCVGASLLLGAQWLGLIPDTAAIEMRARRELSETIAIQSTPQIRDMQWLDLRKTLQTTVDHHEKIVSIGVRSRFGALKVDTGHHGEVWPATQIPNPNDSDSDDSDSGQVDSSAQEDALPLFDADGSPIETAFVPIQINHRQWGRVEFCYQRKHETTLQHTLADPLIKLVAFFMCAGLVSYSLFVARMMGIFTSTQVVPDRVRQALDTLAEGLLVLDENSRIVLANKAFATMVCIPSEELENQLACDLLWTKEDQSLDHPWKLAIDDLELQTERMLRLNVEGSGERIFSVNAAPLGKDNAQRGALATFRDVTHMEEHRLEQERMLNLLQRSRDEITQKNEELQILATRDSLTGCLNRRAFFEQFDELWKDAKKKQLDLSAIMIDIDHFKSVNDTYGHHTGDEVLREVSQTVRELFQDFGVVCRYGGEEFCIVLPGFDAEKAVEQSERIRTAISEIRLDSPAELRLTASLGVSERRFDAKDPQDLINQADACLYVAKREGRNQTVLFNSSMLVQDEPVSQEDKRISETVDIPFQAVTALVSALSFRDAATCEHSRRVADLCARASDGLMGPRDKYVLEVAGLLHDIGKIGVPDHILFKPGRLTPDEWEIMGRHDRIGVDIVAGAFDCPELAEIMGSHHAFYNGAGRNGDLPSGTDLPIGARLLMIADSYDAIVSDRPYRKGRTHEQATKELRECSGTQFDPELVEHFIQKIDSSVPSFATGAMAIQRVTSIGIGSHVETLSAAIQASNATKITEISEQILELAESVGLQGVADSVSQSNGLRISGQTANESQLLREARDLIDTCRETQSQFLRSSLQSDANQRATVEEEG